MEHRSRIFLKGRAAIGSIAGPATEPTRRHLRLLSWNRPTGYGAAAIRHVSSATTGEFSMVITAAHISPIIALIAGVLILLMPRLLNLVVAIYLICIGLIGLGVLRMLHIG
jgi:DUF3096 family protein